MKNYFLSRKTIQLYCENENEMLRHLSKIKITKKRSNAMKVGMLRRTDLPFK
jgi:hypothetical protein